MRDLTDEQIRELELRVSALEFENKQLITKHHKEMTELETQLRTMKLSLKTATEDLLRKRRAEELAALAIQALDDLVRNAGSFKELKKRWAQHTERFRGEL